jgi:hypothetical protein
VSERANSVCPLFLISSKSCADLIAARQCGYMQFPLDRGIKLISRKMGELLSSKAADSEKGFGGS